MESLRAAPGFRDELSYWDAELSLRGAHPESMLNRLIPERRDREFPWYLMPVFDALRKSFDGVPRVLDLGSGPLSMLAHGASGGIIDLTAADPLADEYHALLQKHGHSPNCRLVRCFGERLADSFPLNHFHMIWIHNALDHSQDPAAVVRQSAQVLQIGGYLVIQGWTREGTAEGWNGLHQHDLYLLPDLRLVCESAGHTTPVCLADGLPIRIVEHSEPTAEPKRWLKAVYQKA